jgi:hypothetical protein
VQNVIDRPRKAAFAKQVKPVPEHLADGLVPVARSRSVFAAKVCSVNRHAQF